LPKVATGIILATAGVGLVLLAVSQVEGQRYAYQPLRVPIALIKGQAVAAAFQTNVRGRYYIHLEFLRSIPWQQLEPYVGLDKPTPIRVSWQLLQSRREVASGSTEGPPLGGYGNGQSFGITIGQFDATRGASYQLRAQVHATIPALAQTDPHVQIDPERGSLEHHYIKSWLLGWSGIAAVAGSAIGALTLMVRRLLI